MKSLPALLKSRVMANVDRRKIKPALESDEETCPTTDHQIPANFALSDVTEIHWYYHQNERPLPEQCDELEVITAESDSSIAQSGHYEGLVFRELARKRCEWFDGMPEGAASNVASSSSRDRRSLATSPTIKGRLKFQRQRSSSSVRSFRAEDSESSADDSSRTSTTAPRRTRPTLVPICLPPGCIPEEVIVQVPGSATPLPPEESFFLTVDKQLELDPWMSDIFEQAMSTSNPAPPDLISSPVSSALTVVYDLEEDVPPENNIISNYALKMFLQNHRVGYRRNAICEELEMNTGFVKINGAKFSLWHLRAELKNTLNICNL